MIMLLVFLIILLTLGFVAFKMWESRSAASSADVPIDLLNNDDLPSYKTITIVVPLESLNRDRHIFNHIREKQLLNIRLEVSGNAAPMSAVLYTMDGQRVGYLPSDEKILNTIRFSRRSVAMVSGKSAGTESPTLTVHLHLDLTEQRFHELLYTSN